jgi:hypothetical protein
MSDRSSSETSSFSENLETKDDMLGSATHEASLSTTSGSMYDEYSRRNTVITPEALSSGSHYELQPETSYSSDGLSRSQKTGAVTAEFQRGGEFSSLHQRWTSEGGRFGSETGRYFGRRFCEDASEEPPDLPGDYRMLSNLELNPLDRSQSVTPVNFQIEEEFSENLPWPGVVDQTCPNIAERGGSRSTTGDDEEEEDWDMCAMTERSQDSNFATSPSVMTPVNPDGKTRLDASLSAVNPDGKTRLDVSSSARASRDRKISPMELSTSSEISGASEEASGMSDSLEGADWWKVEENVEGSGEDLGTVSRNISEALDELNNLAESTASAPLGRKSESSEKDGRTLRDRH